MIWYFLQLPVIEHIVSAVSRWGIQMMCFDAKWSDFNSTYLCSCFVVQDSKGLLLFTFLKSSCNVVMVVGAHPILEFGAGNDVTTKLTMFQIQKRRGFFCESFRLGTRKTDAWLSRSSLSLISMCLWHQRDWHLLFLIFQNWLDNENQGGSIISTQCWRVRKLRNRVEAVGGSNATVWTAAAAEPDRRRWLATKNGSSATFCIPGAIKALAKRTIQTPKKQKTLHEYQRVVHRHFTGGKLVLYS